MRYAIVIEKARRNYAAYCPDVPGCVATGDTVAEVVQQMRGALAFHFEGMTEDGQHIPDPTSLVEYVEVPIPVAATPVKSRRKAS
jgi:predicted RNase H-like HicB family nuclease